MLNAEIHLSNLQLYDQYAPALYGVILKVCPERQRAGEILQCVFRKVSLENENKHKANCRTFTFILRLMIEECEQSLQLPKSELIAVIFPGINNYSGTAF